jgi:hypothetical protein
MSEFQGGDGVFSHLRLRARAGGQCTNLTAQLMPENGFGHLRPTGVARAEYKHRLAISHGLLAELDADRAAAEGHSSIGLDRPDIELGTREF